MMWLRRCGLQWHSCLNVRESSGTGRDDGERLWQGAGGAGNRIVRGQNKDMIKAKHKAVRFFVFHFYLLHCTNSNLILY